MELSEPEPDTPTAPPKQEDPNSVKQTAPKLEAASAELQLLRKQVMVERLMKGKSSEKDRQQAQLTSEPVTASPILNRIRDFLPLMKVENERLLQQAEADPASVSIEVEEDSSEKTGKPLVEMNLALFPQEEGGDSGSDDASDSDSSHTNSDDADDDEAPDSSQKKTQNRKKRSKRQRLVEEIDQNTTSKG
jgi:hypothetical protein